MEKVVEPMDALFGGNQFLVVGDEERTSTCYTGTGNV
jgi:hypothetical protein